jgi:hypothetical protein
MDFYAVLDEGLELLSWPTATSASASCIIGLAVQSRHALSSLLLSRSTVLWI